MLPAEQLRELVASCEHPRVESMMRLGGETALRRGEVCGLRWPDLDLQGLRVSVARSVYQEPGRRLVKAPKNGKTRRVALSPACADALGRWFRESVVDGGADARGYVFPAADGGPQSIFTPNQALARACKRAGLVDDPKAEKPRPLVSFHGLRHSAITAKLLSGAPVPTVAQQAGHADPSITLAIYSHVIGDGALDDALGAFSGGGTGGGRSEPAGIAQPERDPA